MAKEEMLEFPGLVKELLPNATFRVELENGHEIIAHTAGKMRRQHAWIKPHSAGKSSKIGKWIVEHYPHYNDDEIDLLLKTNSKDDWKALFEEYGMEPKEIKALLK